MITLVLVLLTALNFPAICALIGVQRGRQGESIVIISPLQSVIRDQVVKINSTEMTSCDLNENLDCLEEIRRGNVGLTLRTRAKVEET